MSLFRRSDGRYVVKWKDPLSRKWAQRSFRDEAAARNFEEEMSHDEPENERMTLGDVVAAYILNVPHCRRTREAYSYLVNGYDRRDGTHTEGPAEFLADKYATELTRRDLENLRLRIRERGVRTYTLNQYVNRLRAALRWAVDQELVPRNPWDKIRRVPQGRIPHRRGTLEDFQRVYPLLPPWLQWACRTAMALCLRPGLGELFSLEWSAFDWRTGSVRVYMPKVNREKIVYPTGAYLAEARARYEADSAAGQTVVCRCSRNHPVHSSTTYGTIWLRTCHLVGVDMQFYAIRHVAASEMLRGGVDLATVAEMLGHSNPATTASFYIHTNARALRAAAEALPLAPVVRDGADSETKTQ